MKVSSLFFVLFLICTSCAGKKIISPYPEVIPFIKIEIRAELKHRAEQNLARLEIGRYMPDSIYPNPAFESITIETSLMIKESVLSIYNVNGQELIKQEIKDRKTQIDISKLTSGIYFVKLISDKTVEVIKIIK